MQLTADQLGIDGDKIRIRQGDTDTIPTGGGTGGARSLYSEGQAILRHRGERDREGQAGRLRGAGGGGRPTSCSRTAGSRIVGTDRGMDILALRRAAARGAKGEDATQLDAAEVAEIDVAHLPERLPHGRGRGRRRRPASVAVLRYIVCDDVGKAVNPMIVRGQVHGGVAQGVGQAVMERTAYDPESGQLLSGSLMDYALPRAADLPDIEVELIEVPCATNPLGREGRGRGGRGRQPAGGDQRDRRRAAQRRRHA